MADRSLAQKSRQDAEHRSGGQYAKTNPCELCGKSTASIAGHYFTSVHHGHGAVGAAGLCLHEKCVDKLNSMSNDDAAEALGKAKTAGAKEKRATKPKIIPPKPGPTPRMKEIDAEKAALRKLDDELLLLFKSNAPEAKLDELRGKIPGGPRYKNLQDRQRELTAERARLYDDQVRGQPAYVLKKWASQ